MPDDQGELPRDPQTAVALGKETLRRVLAPEETAARQGEVVVIDVDSGAHAFGKTMVDCRRKLQAPANARLYGARVGSESLMHFGGFRRRDAS